MFAFFFLWAPSKHFTKLHAPPYLHIISINTKCSRKLKYASKCPTNSALVQIHSTRILSPISFESAIWRMQKAVSSLDSWFGCWRPETTVKCFRNLYKQASPAVHLHSDENSSSGMSPAERKKHFYNQQFFIQLKHFLSFFATISESRFFFMFSSSAVLIFQELFFFIKFKTAKPNQLTRR